jgi:hypothetical protein
MNAQADNAQGTDLEAGAAAGQAPPPVVETAHDAGAAAPASQDGAGGASTDVRAPRSRAESAMARAMARAGVKTGDSASADATDGQAAAGHAAREAQDGDGGDSTQTDAAAGGADADASKAGAATGDDPSPDSTSQAPEDWPREWTERFAALPTDEARQMVLAMNKDMTAGLQRGLQSLAEQRRGSESLFDAMRRTGHETGEVEALLGLSARFKDDPHGVLQTLAEQAGVELSALAADAPPAEFEDAAALAKWASDKARRDLEREQRTQRQREAAERQQVQVRERFQRELADAAGKYGDLRQHWPAVADVLQAQPMLSVDQAYRVARFEALQQQAAQVDTLRAEVAEEGRRKQATQPPPGRGGTGRAAPPKGGQSRAEAALARAERRLAANGAA